MSIQKADWGQIEWIEENRSDEGGLEMRTGIVTLDAGCHHFPHVHYDEQVIHVISGEAVSVINGEESLLKPGDVRHWPMGVMHEAYTVGAKPFVHLLISTLHTEEIGPPVRFSKEKVQSEAMQKMHLEYWLFEAIESVRSRFPDPMFFPYSVFSSSGVLSAQGKTAAPLCIKRCDPLSRPEQAPCMNCANFDCFREERTFYCPYGMEIISVPIYLEKRFMGCIQGGYFWKSGHGPKPDEEVYDTPESTEESVLRMLRQIAGAIRSYCELRSLNSDLSRSYEEAEHARRYGTHLKEELTAAEYEVSELRINRHFLFNSLNSMAAMALRKNETELYEYVMALSNIFRYGLREQHVDVCFRDELDYIRNYLALQKLRFKERLEIVYEIDEDTLDVMMPSNILQPVVENAFVHGFRDYDEKRLFIRSVKNPDSMDVYIENSGLLLGVSEKKHINSNITGNYVHGLSMVNHKLQLRYGNSGRLRLEEDDGQTRFRVHIPDLNG